MELKEIGHIKSDFPTKFGLPRQSGIINELKSHIVFEKDFSTAEAFRGLSEYTHIWVLWGFSETVREAWSPTVRPPRLGGNKRVGVFATRSPFRPNPIGLSCVKLGRLDFVSGQAVLEIFGGDMMDGTPVYDIKPYLPYADSKPDASGGFSEAVMGDRLDVFVPEALSEKLSEEKLRGLIKLLRSDPRPSYQNDESRIYGFKYAGFEIKFTVSSLVATVVAIEKDI